VSRFVRGLHPSHTRNDHEDRIVTLRNFGAIKADGGNLMDEALREYRWRMPQHFVDAICEANEKEMTPREWKEYMKLVSQGIFSTPSRVSHE